MSSLFNAVTKAFVKQRRKMLSKKIYDHHNGIVQAGPYKNMKLGDVSAQVFCETAQKKQARIMRIFMNPEGALRRYGV